MASHFSIIHMETARFLTGNSVIVLVFPSEGVLTCSMCQRTGSATCGLLEKTLALYLFLQSFVHLLHLLTIRNESKSTLEPLMIPFPLQSAVNDGRPISKAETQHVLYDPQHPFLRAYPEKGWGLEGNQGAVGTYKYLNCPPTYLKLTHCSKCELTHLQREKSQAARVYVRKRCNAIVHILKQKWNILSLIRTIWVDNFNRCFILGVLSL